MAQLAILVPWWKADPRFEDTLVSVLSNRPDDCEVWVIHSEPYDDPWQLEGEVRFLHVRAKNEVALINAGWQATTAPFIHILHCGYEAIEGWVEQALPYFGDERVATVVPLVLAREKQHLIFSAGVQIDAWSRRRMVACGLPVSRWDPVGAAPIGPMLSAAFLRRAALLHSGGYDEWLGPAADVDLALRWRRDGWQSVTAPSCRLVGPCDERTGCSPSSVRYLARLYWRYAPAPTWRALMGQWFLIGDLFGQSRSARQFARGLWESWLGFWDTRLANSHGRVPHARSTSAEVTSQRYGTTTNPSPIKKDEQPHAWQARQAA